MNRSGFFDYRNEIFLGREELNRQQELYRNSLISIMGRFGSKGLFNLKNEGLQLSYTTDNSTGEVVFKLEKSNLTSEKLIGFDGESPIYFSETKEARSKISTNTTVYLGIRRSTNSYEKGLVSLSSNGFLRGVGTEFTKLFRNRQSKRVSRLKIEDQVYEVDRVLDDTSLYLLGSSFKSVSGAKYIVLPTVSPFASDDVDPIYTFETCELIVSLEKFDEKKTFQIAILSLQSASGSIEFKQESELNSFGANSIKTDDLVDGSITGKKIGPGEVKGINIEENSILRKHLNPNLGDVKFGFWNFFGVSFDDTGASIGVGPNYDKGSFLENGSLFLTEGKSMFTVLDFSYEDIKKIVKIVVELNKNFELSSYSSVQACLGYGYNDAHCLKVDNENAPSYFLHTPIYFFVDVIDLNHIKFIIHNYDPKPITRTPSGGQINVSAFIKRTDDIKI